MSNNSENGATFFKISMKCGHFQYKNGIFSWAERIGIFFSQVLDGKKKVIKNILFLARSRALAKR